MAKSGGSVSCYMTGEDLLSELQLRQDDENYCTARSHALGYIGAVIDAHALFREVEQFPAVFDLTSPQLGHLAEIISKDLSDERPLLDGTAASLIVRILQRHFPSAERGSSQK